MNYDEVKQEELVTTAPNAAELANNILNSITAFIEKSNDTSPLAQFHNVMVLLDKMEDIIQQTHNAALEYLRADETKISTICCNYAEEAKKLAPSETRDGITYQVLRWANFRNLAVRDKILNSLLLAEKETNVAVKRIQTKISKRINELRASPEFKKAKPAEVCELIYVNNCKA